MGPDTKLQGEGYLKQIAEIKKQGVELNTRLFATHAKEKSKAARIQINELYFYFSTAILAVKYKILSFDYSYLNMANFFSIGPFLKKRICAQT